jgi:hypothetical protein
VSSNAAAEVARNLRGVRARAEISAPAAAATAAGQAGETMVKMVLQVRTHELGTPTPSQPGQPPAKISGALARSIQRTPTVRLGAGIASTAWGSKLIYAPVQEYGAVISAKNFPQLGNPTVGFFGKHVRIPPRPFMELSTRRLMYSGTLTRVASAAFLEALDI